LESWKVGKLESWKVGKLKIESTNSKTTNELKNFIQKTSKKNRQKGGLKIESFLKSNSD